MEPFIKNHQFNLIKHQAALLQKQVHGIIDQDVETAVRAEAESKVLSAFDELTDEQKSILSDIFFLNTEEERFEFLKRLSPFRRSFPVLDQLEVKKLFSYVKKLKLPVLKEIDFTSVTYLGWKDIGASRHYLIYNLKGKLIGVEGRYVISTKKGICEICNRYGDVAFMSVSSRKSGAEKNKSFGKYMCYDTKDCNLYIQNPEKLEAFIQQLIP
ncbi:elongation factor G-binding protein [Jeotgalibacillus sp. S-D1]|uniref:FusB/FusC family EF-G-binding protein n=1 Tax=Jeotgalibacillus sp. S-D1 TaxID=2552189 RepID=UPI00105975FC|nr:FusB/FusC family EF-G-binding protein [Jeotgalibacillus sp. S-D1]TDL31454.1 elongation factor G-binding protein [Jeotgalibacillus sp. S-D1]